MAAVRSAGPLYYNVLAAAGADRYVSMGSTYGNVNNPAIKLNVEAMVLAFPLESITVGIGTTVPAACNCKVHTLPYSVSLSVSLFFLGGVG